MKHKKPVRSAPLHDALIAVGGGAWGLGTVYTHLVNGHTAAGTVVDAIMLAAFAPWAVAAVSYWIKHLNWEPEEEWRLPYTLRHPRPVDLELAQMRQFRAAVKAKVDSVETELRADGGPSDISEMTLFQVGEPNTGTTIQAESITSDAIKTNPITWPTEPPTHFEEMLQPGWFEQLPAETEDEYWTRLCGHERHPERAHMLTCPQWKPRI